MDLEIFNCRAQWITMGDNDVPAPLFRKEFELTGPADKVICKISGLGSYILYIDGMRIGDSILEPRFSNYNRSVYYNVLELPSLEKGRHTVGVMLGRSRRAMLTENTWGWHKPPWDTKRQLVLQIDVYYSNGTYTCIRSDETWKYQYGPVRFDCLYAGEAYDAGHEIAGWNKTGLDISNWSNAILTVEPAGKLVLQESPPIRPIRSIRPEVTGSTGTGSLLYRFSENVAGNARILAFGKKGSSYRVRYGEKLCEDLTVDSEYCNVEGTLQEDTYIFGDTGQAEFLPLFSYKGFRYIEIVKDGDVDILDLEGLVYHNILENTGRFSCSSDMLTRLHENALRALLSNLHHTPTDTPIYEKNGWTGDAQLTSLVALYNFNVRNLYGTWMSDFADAQHENGEIPPIVPSPGWGYSSSDFGWEDAKPALPAWDAAYFEIIYNLNLFYGCTELVARHFENLEKYISYLSSCADGYIIRTGLGDWLAPTGEDHSEPLLQPGENHLSSTAYFFRMAGMLSEFAGMLNKPDEERKYNELSNRILMAFNESYLDYETGIYSSGQDLPYRQTPNVIALAFGLVPSDLIEKTAAALVQDITVARKGHLWTGIIGTSYILNALCETGYTDLAYSLVLNETYPSWGYWLKNGATSMYESWELDSRSRNHHMYGTLDSWFYGYLCGIRPMAPGFSKVIIKPFFPSGLEKANASYYTGFGEISVGWIRENGKIIVEAIIPPGIEAVFYDTKASFKSHELKTGLNMLEV